MLNKIKKFLFKYREPKELPTYKDDELEYFEYRFLRIAIIIFLAAIAVMIFRSF